MKIDRSLVWTHIDLLLELLLPCSSETKRDFYCTVISKDFAGAVSYAGLDFYAGYLHADRPVKPFLVLDMMEEFRQQLVDRTLIGLITKNVIKPNEILAFQPLARD